ncbi:hypothetical protein N7488_006725 [Penicillium malachiteum]|nr:hypothetical protein N7488_006725 [Penicillium malachiteum]
MAPTPVNMDATHFCARPSGDMTSMICVDDLPDGMTIDGAPRKLSPAETQGMTSCGMMPKRPDPWMINHDDKIPVHNGRNGRNGFDQLKSFLYELMEDDAVPSGHRDTIGKLMSEFPDEPIPSNALIKISPTLTTSSNSSYNRRCFDQTDTRYQQARGYGRKEYCSYWIRHGECDYQQQGCLFKHEMPLEKELLETLGLRDIPRWYRDKYGLRSLLSTPDYPHAAHTTRLAIADPPHSKAIAYPENCADSALDKSVASSAVSHAHGNSGQSFQGPIIRSTRTIGGGKKGRGHGANGQQKGNGGRGNGNNQNQKSGETTHDGSSVVLMPESASSGTKTGKSGHRRSRSAWRRKISEISTSHVVNTNVNAGAMVKKTSPLANEVTLDDPNEQTTSQIVISLTPPSTKPSPVSSLAISYSSPVMPAPDTDPDIKATADSSKAEDSAGAKGNVDAVTVANDDNNTEENVTPTVSMPEVIPTGPKADRVPAGPKADRLPPTAAPFSPARSSVRGGSFASPSRRNEGSPTDVSPFGSARSRSYRANNSVSRRSRRAGNISTSSVATVRASQQPNFSQYVSPVQHPNPVHHASSARHMTTAQQMIPPQQASHATFGHPVGPNMPVTTPDFQLVPHPWHPNVRRMQGAGGPIDVVDNFPSFGGVRPLPFDYSDPSCPTIEITEASPVQDIVQGFPVHGPPAQGLPAQGISGQGLPGHGLPGHSLPGHSLPGHGLPGQPPSGHGFSRQGFAGPVSAGQGFTGPFPAGHGFTGPISPGHEFTGQGFPPSQPYVQGTSNWPVPAPGLPLPAGHPAGHPGNATNRSLNPNTAPFAPRRRNLAGNLSMTHREAYADDDYDSLDHDCHFRGLKGLWDHPGTYPANPRDAGHDGPTSGFTLDLSKHWLADEVRGILRGMAPDDHADRASAQKWANNTFGEVISENVNSLLDSEEDENPIPPPWDRGSEAFVPRHDGPFCNDL